VVGDPLGPPHYQIFHIQSAERRRQILPGQAEFVDQLLGVHWSTAPLCFSVIAVSTGRFREYQVSLGTVSTSCSLRRSRTLWPAIAPFPDLSRRLRWVHVE
jgi:hypothetical protein